MKIDCEIRKLLHSCAAMNSVRMIIGSFHVFYLFSMGVSISQIAILQMVFSISIFIFELPTGILGDKLGVKQNVIISCIFYGLFFPLCTYAPNMAYLVTAEIFYALGACFVSGADSTWIKGLVDKIDDKDENTYHYYVSYIREINALMNSFSGLLGVFIVVIIGNYEVAYYLCGFLFLLLTFSFNQVKSVKDRKDVTKIKERFNVYLHIKNAIMQLVSTKASVYYTLICGFIIAAMQPIFHFWQPFILKQTGLLDNASNNKEIIILGACFFSYSFTKYLFNRYVRKMLLTRYKPMNIILVATTMSALSMLALLVFNGQWVPIILFSIFHSFFSIPMSQFESEYFKHLKDENSNTVLSIISLLARAFGIFSLAVIGILADHFTISAAFIFSLICIMFIIPITILWMKNNREINKSNEHIAEVL